MRGERQRFRARAERDASLAAEKQGRFARVEGKRFRAVREMRGDAAAALSAAQHEVEVRAAAPGVGIVRAGEIVDLIGVEHQSFPAVVREDHVSAQRGDHAVIGGQGREVGLVKLDGRGAQPPKKIAVGIHRALRCDGELGGRAAGPLRGDVIGGGQMGERHKRTFFLSKRLRYDDTEAFCVWQDKF